MISSYINTKKDLTIVQRHQKSLLEELNEFAVKKDKESVLETRATHVINSAINLLALIRETFEPEEAYDLERRFLNSIRGSDASKFTRGIRKIKNSKETAKSLKIIRGDITSDD